MAISLGSALLIFQVILDTCYCKKSCREDCCGSRHCFKTLKLIHTIVQLLAAIAVLIFTSIAMS